MGMEWRWIGVLWKGTFLVSSRGKRGVAAALEMCKAACRGGGSGGDLGAAMLPLSSV